MKKLFALLLCLSFLITLVACSSPAPPPTEPEIVDSEELEETPATANTVGSTVIIKDVEITLIGMEEHEGVANRRPAEDNAFLNIEFDVRNNATEDFVCSPINFHARIDDQVVPHSFDATTTIEGNEQLGGIIAPGKNLTGFLGFEIPSEWIILEISFCFNNHESETVIFVIENPVA